MSRSFVHPDIPQSNSLVVLLSWSPPVFDELPPERVRTPYTPGLDERSLRRQMIEVIVLQVFHGLRAQSSHLLSFFPRDPCLGLQPAVVFYWVQRVVAFIVVVFGGICLFLGGSLSRALFSLLPRDCLLFGFFDHLQAQSFGDGGLIQSVLLPSSGPGSGREGRQTVCMCVYCQAMRIVRRIILYCRLSPHTESVPRRWPIV